MLNDDLIGAYLDGELDAERRAEVERGLQLDSGAAARLERMRSADALLKRAFQRTGPDENAALAQMIMTPAYRAQRHGWATRVAALAAAVAVGLGVGELIKLGDGGASPYAITTKQAALLDTLPSGAAHETGLGNLEMVLSIQSDAGALCRQFRLTSGAQSTDVLACRSGGDTWAMQAAAPAANAAGRYMPASGISPLDAAISMLGPVVALDENQERVMIEEGWK
jgi:hypothetical protein